MGEMDEVDRLLWKYKYPFHGEGLSPCPLYTKCKEVRDISVISYSQKMWWCFYTIAGTK